MAEPADAGRPRRGHVSEAARAALRRAPRARDRHVHGLLGPHDRRRPAGRRHARRPATSTRRPRPSRGATSRGARTAARSRSAWGRRSRRSRRSRRRSTSSSSTPTRRTTSHYYDAVLPLMPAGGPPRRGQRPLERQGPAIPRKRATGRSSPSTSTSRHDPPRREGAADRAGRHDARPQEVRASGAARHRVRRNFGFSPLPHGSYSAANRSRSASGGWS